jgi:hypothetical protein
MSLGISMDGVARLTAYIYDLYLHLEWLMDPLDWTSMHGPSDHHPSRPAMVVWRLFWSKWYLMEMEQQE